MSESQVPDTYFSDGVESSHFSALKTLSILHLGADGLLKCHRGQQGRPEHRNRGSRRGLASRPFSLETF